MDAGLPTRGSGRYLDQGVPLLDDKIDQVGANHVTGALIIVSVGRGEVGKGHFRFCRRLFRG